MTTVHNFHVPLPEDVYHQLREEAQRLHQPATQIARHAIEGWLQDQRRGLLHEAIRAYAQEQAGSRADLDADLEAAAAEHLADLDKDGS